MTDPGIIAIQGLAVPWLRDVDSAQGHYLWLDFAPKPSLNCCVLRFRGTGVLRRPPDYGYIEGVLTEMGAADPVFPSFMMEHGLAPRQLFLCHFEWDGAFNALEGHWDGDLAPQFVLKEHLDHDVVQLRWERYRHLLELWRRHYDSCGV